MKEQYSVWAKKALKQAEKIAKQYSHYIGTEHLLAGLLAVEEGTAGLMLTEAGVTEEKLFQLIDELVDPSQATTLERSQEYTPRTKRVLELAKSEAEKLGDKEIGTEHILIAMLKEYDCVALRRGKGLMQGLVIQGRPVGDIVKKALENGLVVITAGSDVLRIVPPLVITRAEIDEMIGKLEMSLKA